MRKIQAEYKEAQDYERSAFVVPLEQFLSVEKELNELQEKYDTLATENMLEVNEICNQRDAAIDALMKIEDIFIDGDDTYEDWKSMGQIARTFFEKNT
jgi:hypothetical protein